jgi:TolB-like protein/class 3 adenylate cyclase/Tfp pilus assembly protein PilF
MASTRRLAAILAADVAGYSRLMGADEEGTHERLKAHRRELVDPKISAHSGRIVKTTGDGMMGEFASVVDAVRCAAEWQRSMIHREAGIPEDRRIRFRIGINLGDVIVEDDDIFGDGVNIAARLEALAEPSGICISGTVYDQIRDKLSYQFDDLGEQSVKNIARPVRVYARRPEAIAGLPVAVISPAVSISQPIVAPRLSIVVLPFANLSNDPEQQYFADGITEDVTTDLSRLAQMVVISRNTAFTYRNKSADTKQIGRELGVRYILEGSVRRSGNQVRINTQLIDAETDAHLWAERLDRNTSDLFAVQDEITSRIAVALNVEMIGAEAARTTEHPDTLDYLLRARAAGQRPATRDLYSKRVTLIERALELDPNSVDAQSMLATVLVNRVLDNMTDSVAADIARAETLVGKALAVSPRSPLAHYAKGQILRQKRRNEEAIPEYEMVIASNRNWAVVYSQLGLSKFNTGSIEEMIPLAEYAIRLSPRDEALHLWYNRIGLVHLLQSRIDDAIVWFERARAANPEHSNHHAHLCSVYALNGDTERAAGELAEARRLSADDRFSSLARLKAIGYFGVPKIRALFEATYFVGLRLAGMPEE